MKKKKDAKEEKAKPGQPTKYKDSYAKVAFKLCLLGATDQDLADAFDINVDTVYEWKKRHAKFSEAIKEGKDTADAQVAHSLFQRAVGYSHKAHKIQLDRSGKWQTKEYVERYPPSEVAAIFWLKNRKPKEWREKLDIEQKTIIVKHEDDEHPDDNNAKGN